MENKIAYLHLSNEANEKRWPTETGERMKRNKKTEILKQIKRISFISHFIIHIVVSLVSALFFLFVLLFFGSWLFRFSIMFHASVMSIIMVEGVGVVWPMRALPKRLKRLSHTKYTFVCVCIKAKFGELEQRESNNTYRSTGTNGTHRKRLTHRRRERESGRFIRKRDDAAMVGKKYSDCCHSFSSVLSVKCNNALARQAGKHRAPHKNERIQQILQMKGNAKIQREMEKKERKKI